MPDRVMARHGSALPRHLASCLGKAFLVCRSLGYRQSMMTCSGTALTCARIWLPSWSTAGPSRQAQPHVVMQATEAKGRACCCGSRCCCWLLALHVSRTRRSSHDAHDLALHASQQTTLQYLNSKQLATLTCQGSCEAVQPVTCRCSDQPQYAAMPPEPFGCQ